LAALRRAWDDNLNALGSIVTTAGELTNQPVDKRPSDADLENMIQKIVTVTMNMVELTRWIYRPKVLSPEQAFEKAQAFKELGDDYVEDLIQRSQKLNHGRPAAKRRTHIAAYEYMLQSKDNSLGKAVQKFCTCGKRHSPECYEQMKAGIHSLKRILRKYAPELVAKYDLLHPDKAKHSITAKSPGFSPHQQ
jgi:hypothetical protein